MQNIQKWLDVAPIAQSKMIGVKPRATNIHQKPIGIKETHSSLYGIWFYTPQNGF